MAQDQNLEEVLIARNNETGEVGAVTGLKEDGTPKMTDVKSAKLSDLVKFQKGQNPIEAFLSNFVRQCQNPTTFGFFRVPADRYDTVGTVIGDLAKDPEANAEMLKNNKVELPTEEQKVEQPQQAATPTEQPTQAAASENVQATDKEVKHSAIDESKIDWASLKEKWGIDRDALERSGDLKEMLYNRKSKLVTVTPTFAGEKFPIDARLSFRTDPDGNVKVVPHFIHREPKLDQKFEGYEFSKEDKAALRETVNLGKVVELTDKNGNKVPSYVSIDRLTNEVVSVPVKDVFIRDTIGHTKLTIAEVMQLKEGKPLPPKEISDKNGRTYNVVLQVSADRKGVEFVPGGARRVEQKEQHQQSNGQQQSSWLTKDGQIKPISKWAGVPMTPQQQADYTAGKVVVMTDMVDKKGQPCTVYLQFNPEKQRPTTSLNDPRVKVAEESKTQKAVNNDGLTNEATKHVAEPLQKYQTEPKNKAQQEQQRKPKGPRM
ncbi:DUF4099 domain-containing protein [Muribaculum intestinale]|uniref:DUF4099 domain-containing protein n=1 Tax=Muribaculum intestinale TaxID=1796646 RepID=A0A4S2FYP1_9BACT|nr:DUF4099 domain-containing protein [Muribaculum intestinale]MYM12202.1 DUF4099 domain-containing protein [Muribaculum intestinale]TGY74586.1 DUF4099 domain-containing protein [Muribaculum intestinale]